MVETENLKQFLCSYRSKQEIERKFQLSNTQSWHLLKWYLKVKSIECKNLTGVATHKRGIIKVYRWCDEEDKL